MLTLALCIGANTTIFSLADATLLRPFRGADPSQLVVFKWTSAYPDYLDYVKRTDLFTGGRGHAHYAEVIPRPEGGVDQLRIRALVLRQE